MNQEPDSSSPVESWGDALALAANLPPEGGTIKLPDGTVIQITPVEDDERRR